MLTLWVWFALGFIGSNMMFANKLYDDWTDFKSIRISAFDIFLYFLIMTGGLFTFLLALSLIEWTKIIKLTLRVLYNKLDEFVLFERNKN